jgi:hypothetical protein
MSAVALALTLLASSVPIAGPGPLAPALHGRYVEARTADVYGGPCTATAIAADDGGLPSGHDAILAWQIEAGTRAGVDLSGLAVVVVLPAEAPLGSGAAGGRSLIVVDVTANAAQRAALERVAREAAGHLLGEVVAVEAAPIEFAVDPTRALARVRVADVAEVATRAFNRLDGLCGTESVSSPPLVSGVAASPAVTLEHAFFGSGLGATWAAGNRRGAFVGTFAL